MLRPPDAELLFADLYKRLVLPCRKCGGSGKTVRSATADPLDDERRIVRCDCLNEVTLRCRLSEGNVPEEFHAVEEFRFEFNTTIADEVRGYCADLPAARREGLGWVFCGENGSGKTSLGCFILARAARAGFSVGYLTTQEYLSTIIPSGHDPALADWFRQVQTADFFVLDELGKETRREVAEGESSFWLASLDSLIRQRTQNLRPTVLISNFNAAEFQKVYGASFASILAHRVEYRKFAPGDYRAVVRRRRRERERGGEE